MISGASKLAYWTSNYVIDVTFHLIYAMVGTFTIQALDMDVPEAYRLLISFAFINPMFVYALSFLFDSDSKASVVIRVLYFVMGGCAPIAA